MKILLAWIGNSDKKAVKPDNPSDKSPIFEAIQALAFDVVHLISTFPKSETNDYIDWVKQHKQIKISPVQQTIKRYTMRQLRQLKPFRRNHLKLS
jgi:hypothetical protein